jgi:hypothetical protein
MADPKFSEVFPVGSQVRCESEMWPGKWEDGTVVGHLETRFGTSWAIRIETPTALVDYDYRFLDEDPHLSLVRKVK